MEKLDNVIAALECCLDSFDACPGCYLNDYAGCVDQLKLDALDFLKEYRDSRGDLISRSALLAEYEWLKSQVNPCSVPEIEEHMARIRKAPTVETEPVVHAHWIVANPKTTCCGYSCEFTCSNCGCSVELPYAMKELDWERCHRCGAHMDEEVAE